MHINEDIEGVEGDEDLNSEEAEEEEEAYWFDEDGEVDELLRLHWQHCRRRRRDGQQASGDAEAQQPLPAAPALSAASTSLLPQPPSLPCMTSTGKCVVWVGGRPYFLAPDAGWGGRQGVASQAQAVGHKAVADDDEVRARRALAADDRQKRREELIAEEKARRARLQEKDARRRLKAEQRRREKEENGEAKLVTFEDAIQAARQGRFAHFLAMVETVRRKAAGNGWHGARTWQYGSTGGGADNSLHFYHDFLRSRDARRETLLHACVTPWRRLEPGAGGRRRQRPIFPRPGLEGGGLQLSLEAPEGGVPMEETAWQALLHELSESHRGRLHIAAFLLDTDATTGFALFDMSHDLDDQGRAVVHAIAEACDSLFLQLLLRHKARYPRFALDLNQLSALHLTPLHYAAVSAGIETVALLLSHGASPLMRVGGGVGGGVEEGGKGETPLEMVQSCLEGGAIEDDEEEEIIVTRVAGGHWGEGVETGREGGEASYGLESRRVRLQQVAAHLTAAAAARQLTLWQKKEEARERRRQRYSNATEAARRRREERIMNEHGQCGTETPKGPQIEGEVQRDSEAKMSHSSEEMGGKGEHGNSCPVESAATTTASAPSIPCTSVIGSTPNPTAVGAAGLTRPASTYCEPTTLEEPSTESQPPPSQAPVQESSTDAPASNILFLPTASCSLDPPALQDAKPTKRADPAKPTPPAIAEPVKALFKQAALEEKRRKKFEKFCAKIERKENQAMASEEAAVWASLRVEAAAKVKAAEKLLSEAQDAEKACISREARLKAALATEEVREEESCGRRLDDQGCTREGPEGQEATAHVSPQEMDGNAGTSSSIPAVLSATEVSSLSSQSSSILSSPSVPGLGSDKVLVFPQKGEHRDAPPLHSQAHSAVEKQRRGEDSASEAETMSRMAKTSSCQHLRSRQQEHPRQQTEPFGQQQQLRGDLGRTTSRDDVLETESTSSSISSKSDTHHQQHQQVLFHPHQNVATAKPMRSGPASAKPPQLHSDRRAKTLEGSNSVTKGVPLLQPGQVQKQVDHSAMMPSVKQGEEKPQSIAAPAALASPTSQCSQDTKTTIASGASYSDSGAHSITAIPAVKSPIKDTSVALPTTNSNLPVPPPTAVGNGRKYTAEKGSRNFVHSRKCRFFGKGAGCDGGSACLFRHDSGEKTNQKR